MYITYLNKAVKKILMVFSNYTFFYKLVKSSLTSMCFFFNIHPSSIVKIIFSKIIRLVHAKGTMLPPAPMDFLFPPILI